MNDVKIKEGGTDAGQLRVGPTGNEVGRGGRHVIKEEYNRPLSRKRHCCARNR